MNKFSVLLLAILGLSTESKAAGILSCSNPEAKEIVASLYEKGVNRDNPMVAAMVDLKHGALKDISTYAEDRPRRGVTCEVAAVTTVTDGGKMFGITDQTNRETIYYTIQLVDDSDEQFVVRIYQRPPV